MVWSLRAGAIPALVWQRAVQLLDRGCVSQLGTYAFCHLVLKWGLLSGKPSPVCFQSYAKRGLALEVSKHCYHQASFLIIGGHMCLATSAGACNPTLVCLRYPRMVRDAAVLALVPFQRTGWHSSGSRLLLLDDTEMRETIYMQVK